ncbi:potassium transporter [Bdellovibrio bacteriovorus]|uniref:Potassium transporter n=1 Tax=Bdellovibrio bacteriovorus TaxID=959 RepID=A0A150WN42_BDEBC|nr:monovalent cation:proton antiporter-2 (CPA2) family protein [Bdellovibrio bacteriovorus]KYG65901.1 potassium transporter [Bdellovibrio bacteriovorus]
MSAELSSHGLDKIVVLLVAAITMVPLFKKIGLGSVLGYLVAGLIVGPFGLRLFRDAGSVLHIAEMGVVMFLFVIGLEMRPKHLWSLRKDIFGLGALQIFTCIGALTLLGLVSGYSLAFSLLGAAGFVMTSTAIVFQFLAERKQLADPPGEKIVSILLFEDLLIVPLLAIVALASQSTGGGQEVGSSGVWGIVFPIAAMVGLIVVGIWLLNPFFRILSLAKSREVMTAAALLVVLGTALAMQLSGLSMAMGAFLAGVFLAESTFRHQIEADIEPFRGLLLGLFFMAVGMSLDLSVVYANLHFVLAAVVAMMAVKAACVYAVARVTGSPHRMSIERAILMAQGGEFAFVLFSAGAFGNLITAEQEAMLTATVVLSMVLTPLAVILMYRLLKDEEKSLDGVEKADGLSGNVLVIGFGRFGQVFCQLLLMKNADVTIIDSDVDIIKSVSRFGFKVYYGDGSRLDVLRASGAGTAELIAIAVDDKEVANKIIDLVKSEFPLAKILVRTWDRTHAREVVTKGVDFQVRETFESAIVFGEACLKTLGVSDEEAADVAQRIRDLDADRFELELAAGNSDAGREVILGNVTKPEPLVKPKRIQPEGAVQSSPS